MNYYHCQTLKMTNNCNLSLSQSMVRQTIQYTVISCLLIYLVFYYDTGGDGSGNMGGEDGRGKIGPRHFSNQSYASRDSGGHV